MPDHDQDEDHAGQIDLDDAVPFVPEPDPDEIDDEHDEHDEHDDGVLVLPWWQHPLNIVTLLIATALVAGMVGWIVSDARDPMGGNEVDVGFLQDMREHHEQAVTMGLMYLERPETDPRLRTVARSVVFGQGVEIGRMIQLLRDMDADEANMGDTAMGWMGMSSAVGSMPGMASPAELEELGRAMGREADEVFVRLMTAHHLGGVDMAQFAADRAGSDEVRAMAAAIAGAQLGEIVEMRGILER